MDETQRPDPSAAQEPAAEPAATPASIEELQAALQEERKKAESYLASWQRSAADFANYKRRTEEERATAAKLAGSLVILKLLPCIDDLERALAALPKELAGLTWVDGIALIHRKMLAALESEGVKPIEALGAKFDPTLHEAVMQGPGEENTVVAELQRGYTMNGIVLRPALVKVGNGQREAAPEATPAPSGE